MGKPVERLGRGLSALIQPRTTAQSTDPNVPLPENADAASPRHVVLQLPLHQIKPSPCQPRTAFDETGINELAASIRAEGIIQPIIVRTLADGTYELVAGERRWRAAKVAGLQSIPALVRDVSLPESLQIALIENLQREDLTPLERAFAYRHYLDNFGGTIDELADRLGESRGNVSNYLRLLNLRPEICYMLGSGQLSMGQARAIAALDDVDRQLAIAKLSARRNLSVRQVEELVRRAIESVGQEPSAFTGRRAAVDRHLTQVEQSLSRSLGLPVRLFPGRRKNSGRVVISYSNLEEFDRIAERLGGAAALE